MGTKHTPGPWFFEAHASGENIGTVWGESTMKIARVYDTTRSGSGDDEVSEANARLIAAAPALADAVELLSAYLDMRCGNLSSETRAVQATARAVLRAAGREANEVSAPTAPPKEP